MGPSRLIHRIVPALLAPTVTLALVAGMLGLLVDGARLAWAGVPAAMVLAGATSAAALALLLALGAGPVLAATSALAERLARSGLVGRLLAPLPGLGLAAYAAFAITNVRHRQDPAMRQLLVALAAGLVALCLFASRASAHRLWRIVALAVALAMLAVDAMLPRWYYRELHDLLAMVTVAGLTAFVLPWLRPRSPRRLLAALGLGLLGACAVLLLVDRGAPGWRARAHEHGLYGDALARASRALVDFDRDGFSPVAWGGDCDDFTRDRHPLAPDAPGRGDPNCNGIDPPVAATDAQRGLAPPLGEPGLPTGAVDVVLLVTVDALRGDVATPSLMPKLSAAARGGLRFTNAYTSSTRTAQALPLMQQSRRGGVPLGFRLAAAGITTTAVIGDSALEGTEIIAKTFARTDTPERGRWPAAQVTARALRAIDHGGARPHYLWLHYYDAHTPYPPPGQPPVPTPPGLDGSFAGYAAGVAAADSALGELLAGLEQRGRLARTVVIVTGDHGEAFGEHGMLFHAASAFEPVVRVPAVLLAPGLPALEVGHVVSHADIFPTVVGAFGMATPDDEGLGRSWFRLRQAPQAPLHNFVVIRSALATSGGDVMSPLLAIVDGRHKLIKALEDGLTQLYDVAADPGEVSDLWPLRPELGRQLEAQLELYRDLVGYPADEELADLRTFGARLIGPRGELH